jgi:hypothetical protein
MIYNAAGASYYYSKSFSTTANKYYEISIDVYTQSYTNAYIRFRSSAWYDSGAIDTKNEWKTYKFYIEAHQTSSKSISIQLWNGLDGNRSANAAFFDNVKITELKKSEYAAKQNGDPKISLRLPNPNFDATSSTYSNTNTPPTPVSPNDYSQVAGTSKDASKASAPGSSSRISYGVVSSDYTNSEFKGINDGLAIKDTLGFIDPTSDFPNDGFLLMLWNKDYTAYGYKSNSSSGIVLERGQYYKISVRVMTEGLSSIEYQTRDYGDYYKASNGTYTKITSTAKLLNSAGEETTEMSSAAQSNGFLAVRANLPTKTATTIPRYLNVIGKDGQLMIKDTESVAKEIVATLWSLKNNSSSSSESKDNLFITLESAIGWLEAAYADTGNEAYRIYDDDNVPLYHIEDEDGTRIYYCETNSSGKPIDKDGVVVSINDRDNLVRVYQKTDENGKTTYYKLDDEGKEISVSNVTSLWTDSDVGSIGHAVVGLLFNDPEVNADKEYDRVVNEDGEVEFVKNGDFNITYRQFRTYMNAYTSFEKDMASANLYFSTDNSYYTSTSYKYGMQRYIQGDATPLKKDAVSSIDGTPLGGNLKLTTSSISIEIKGIITEGVWEEYTFYIRANQFQNTDFAISYNLGEGGAEDVDTHIKGFMFVDSLTLESAENWDKLTGFGDTSKAVDKGSDVNGVKTIKNVESNYVIADIASENDDNLIQNWDFGKGLDDEDGGWIVEQPDQIDPEKETSYKHVENDADGYQFGRVDATDGAGLPYEMSGYSNQVLTLTANTYGIFQIRPLYAEVGPSDEVLNALNAAFGTIQIAPLSYYRLSVWIKTADIPETSDAKVNVYLVGYTENKKNEGIYQVKNNDGEIVKSYDRTELSSVTGVKTPDDEDAEYNGYTEVVFYIGGNRIYQDYQYVDLEITFGSGDYMSPKTLAKGSVSIAYPSLYKIAYKEYSSASTSGSYTKKYDFPTASIPGENTFTNGEFDSIDIENTEIGGDGKLSKPSVPSSWTFQEGKVGGGDTLTKYDVISGVIDLDNVYMIIELADNYGIFSDALKVVQDKYDDLLDFWYQSEANVEKYKDEIKEAAYALVYGENNSNKTELVPSNSLLMLSNIVPNENGDPVGESVAYGYKSTSSKSLSANKYYRISVMAMSLVGTPDAYIYLTSSSTSPSMIYGDQKTEYKLGSVPDEDGSVGSIGTDWKEYVFYIEVGQSSVSINLEFWLGDKDKKNTTEGIILIDNVRVEEIPETQEIGTKEYYSSGYFEAVLDYIEKGKGSAKGYSNDGEYSLFDRNAAIKIEWAYLANEKLNNGKATYTQDFIALTYMTDSFDNHGDNKSDYVTANEQVENEDEKRYLYSPTGWSGSLLKGTQSEVVAGVIDLSINKNVENILFDVTEPLNFIGGMGNYMLVIWNSSNDLSYTYTSSSKSLSSSSIYEISVYVKTIDIAPDKNAYVYLTLGTTNLTFKVNSAANSRNVAGYEDNDYAVDEKTIFDQNINDEDPKADEGILRGYTKLVFYVDNQMKSSISSVSLVFGLGDKEEGLQGAVGIDNFSIKKFTGKTDDLNALRDKYEAAYVAADKTVDTSDENRRQFDTVTFISVPSDSVINPPVDTEEEPPAKANLQWLVISSSVVGGATVVIILIYFYQRKKTAISRFVNEKIFKGKLTLFKASKNRRRGISPAVKEIRNEYDKYKED